MASSSSSLRPILSDAAIQQCQRFVIDQYGLSLTQAQQDVLVASVGERMVVTGTLNEEHYLQRLYHEGDGRPERQALFELLSVTDTAFFRGPAQYSGFRQVVIPNLVRRAGGDGRSIRIWSAGCSSGEEAYGLAICLLETLPDPETWSISVVGTDLNQKALETAQRGSYHARAVRSVPSSYLDKYFQKESGRFVVNLSVKELVQFRHHNLVCDSYADAGLHDFDVIVCRNVLFYLTTQAATQVVGRMYDSLVPGGHLWLGHAEMLWRMTDRFEAVEQPDTIYYQRPGRAADGRVRPLDHPFVPLPTVALRSTSSRVTQVPAPYAQGRTEPDLLQSAFQQGLDAYGRRQYQEALEQFEQMVRDQPTLLRAYYMRGLMLTHLGRYDDAVAVLHDLLERDSLHAEGHYLLGIVYQKSGQPTNAIDAFRRAIDADTTMVLAYYQLGELYRLQDSPQAARTAYAQTLKALEKTAADVLVSYSDEFTGKFLTHACQLRIEELRGA